MSMHGKHMEASVPPMRLKDLPSLACDHTVSGAEVYRYMQEEDRCREGMHARENEV